MLLESPFPTGYRYTPQEHAEMLGHFIHVLALEDVILVVQDWGGPIGLSYAVRHLLEILEDGFAS